MYSRFIVNMVSSFQDRENLFLVMDLLGGGDLRYHIGKYKRFTEDQTSTHFLHIMYLDVSDSSYLVTLYYLEVFLSIYLNLTEFIVACLLLALEYLHYNSVVHRDVKPENLVLDEDGYLRLTDLGVARIWKPDN